MTDEVTLSKQTVQELIDGAGHLYYPAFPDEDKRKQIRMAVTAAEEVLEDSA